MTKAWFVYVTAANKKEGESISRALVAEKLAACVSIVPGVSSRYWWQGRIEQSKEILLIIKTTPRRYQELERRVKDLHSYSVPEILATPVVEGNPGYLKWIKNTLEM
jgi:periplasmic divalent cation tolerance protein